MAMVSGGAPVARRRETTLAIAWAIAAGPSPLLAPSSPHLIEKPEGNRDGIAPEPEREGRHHRRLDMAADAERRGDGERPEHVRGMEVAEHHPVADIGP